MNPHGFFEIVRIGNVLAVASAGSYNEEGASMLSEKILEMAPRQAAWAILSDLRAWEMAPESALLRHAQFRARWFEQGCAKIARVMTDGLRREIHQKYSTGVSSDAVQYFTNFSDACTWLTQAGFEIDAGSLPFKQ